MTKGKKLTSVYVDPDNLDNAKIEFIRYKFSLQKLVDRAMHMFLNDEEFRKKIINHKMK
jgi:hypothetical protein